MRVIIGLFFVVQTCGLGAKSVSIRVDERRDYEILDLFFKGGLLDEEYGYVLEGVKPISTRQFYSLDTCPITKDRSYSENEFKNTLLTREAIEVWNRTCAQQDRFALKAVPLADSEPSTCGFEVQFIHVPKLREVIRDNIHLFRYVLGPNWEIEELVQRLAYSQERFTEVLQKDLTLIGIVLGFGLHNSVMGGRLESIDRLSLSRDSAPLLPNSELLQKEGDHLRYGLYYLGYVGGNDEMFKQTHVQLRPSVRFNTLQEEMVALEAKEDPLPAFLQEKPRFIFGAFVGDTPNDLLFRSLQKAQKCIRAILKTEYPLEKVLRMIGGKKPRITCDKSPSTRSVFSLATDPSAQWSAILRGAIHRFPEAKDQLAFTKALKNSPQNPLAPPPMVGASREMFRGLQQATANLAAAENQCSHLSQDTTLRAIVPKLLYVKTEQEGTGETIQNVNRIRLKYTIEDSAGEVLSAQHDIWINLLDAIPGLLHGMQGMRIGEKRTLFIHPSLGYGVLTTFPPCALLVAHVQLLGADLSTQMSLPPLLPLDCTWIRDPRLADAIQQSVMQLPSYEGTFYRNLLTQAELECGPLQLSFEQ